MTIRTGLLLGVDQAGVRVFGDQIEIAYWNGTGFDAPVIGDGVWEAPGERVEVIDGFEVATTRPRLGLHLAAWPRAPERLDQITRAGIVWTPGEVVPDGQGGIEVELYSYLGIGFA